MKVIFLGTPEFAIPSLEKLINWPACEVVAVVTQPDRPAGRGKNIFPPPTKIVANRYSIPVFQPEKLSRAPDVVQSMKDLCPDVLVTVAFGQILKKDVLTMAKYGVVNVHGSLLPKYRGAAPINWAIIEGESTTGITTMLSDPGIDTGAMLLTRSVRLGQDTNAEELAEILSYTGADLLIETLEKLNSGHLNAIAQNDAGATYAPRLDKGLGNIDWSFPASRIHNLVRGLTPWPGTYSYFDSQPVKIIKTALSQDCDPQKNEPGSVIKKGNKILVACGQDGQEQLELLEVKPANKSSMPAAAWANGLRSHSTIILKKL